MNTLLFKKVDEPWKYHVTLNGIEIPHVCNVELIRKENDLPKAVITIVLESTSQNEIILEE